MNEISQIREIEREVSPLPDQAKTLTVNDSEGLKRAEAFLVAVRVMRAKINDAFDPVIKKAHDAHKEAIAQKKKYEGPLLEAERIVKPRIGAYLARLEEERREAERKERERIEAEKRAEEEQIQKAIEAEENGDIEEAEKILNQEPVKLEPIRVPEKPRVSAVHTREIWDWEIEDPESIPRKYLKIDEVKINKIVRVLKGKTDIPGIRVFRKTTVATRVN
jgi:hypothetical protein